MAIFPLALALLVAFGVSASDASPRLRLTERQNELARTTGLRPRDLPASYRGGFVRSRPTGLSCGRLNPPVGDLTATGFAASRFSNGHGAAVTSTVTILANASQVSRDMRRTIRPPLARCLGTLVAKARHATLVSSVRKPLRTDLAYGAAYRIRVRSNGRLQAVSYYVFGHGRIESRLVVEATGSAVPRRVESLAVSLLESRMED